MNPMLPDNLRTYRYGPRKAMTEAADQIERLQAAVADLHRENQRLRNILLDACRKMQTERVGQ